MKEDLIQLLQNHRSEAQGIYIPQDLNDYVAKLAQFARILTIYEENVLQGFIAYYRNDPDKKNAFLSMVLVCEKAQGKGLGKLLMDAAIRDVLQSGFENFALEVLKTNERAKRIYENYGFEVVDEKEKLFIMKMHLS